MNMKIKPEHYQELETAIKSVLDRNPQFIIHYTEQGETPMQIRWRLFNIICDIDNYSLARQLWEYLNDDNIDSALRKITGLI